MQRSKTRVWTEGQHRPAVSTSSIYSSSLGLLTGDRQPQAVARRRRMQTVEKDPCLGLIVGICSKDWL
jgi:hypothetical protein